MLLKLRMVETIKQPPVITRILDNGIVISHIKSNFPGIFRMELIIRAGALDEKKDELGFAHLIEHLMSFFPSKKNRDSVANQNVINSKSISLNAWTEPNTVGYFMSGLDKYSLFITEMMLENYLNPVLDKKIFEQEKNAVAAELSSLINSSNYPMDQVIDFVRFRDTNLSYTILDEKENVMKNATLDNIMSFRNRLYRPEYTNIIIASDRESSQANSFIDYIINTWFSDYKGEKVTPVNYGDSKLLFGSNITYIPDLSPPGPTYNITNIYNTLQSDIPNTDTPKDFKCLDKIPTSGIFYIPSYDYETVCIEFHFPLEIDYFDDRIFIVEALENVLSNGLGSRLYNSLRTKLGAVYHVGANSHIDPRCKNMSTLVVSTETTSDKIKDVFDYILAEFEIMSCREHNFLSENELSKYYNKIDISEKIVSSTLTSISWLEYFKPFVIWGRKIRNINDILKIKKNITIDSLKETAKKIFDSSKMVVFYSHGTNILETKTNSNIHYTVPLKCVNHYKST